MREESEGLSQDWEGDESFGGSMPTFKANDPETQGSSLRKSPSSMFGMEGWELPTLKKFLGLLTGTSPERAVQSEDPRALPSDERQVLMTFVF